MLNRELIAQLKREVIPAVGCTEPVAIALAAAYAASQTEGKVEAVTAKISGNVYKNAKAVGIPGSDQTGVDMALALGIVIRKPETGLAIFGEVTSEFLSQAKELLAEAEFQVEILQGRPSVEIEVEVMARQGGGKALIEGSHNNVTYLSRQRLEDQEPVVLRDEREDRKDSQEAKQAQIPKKAEIDLHELLEEAGALPQNELGFLLEGVSMNLAIAEKGLTLKDGKGIGGAYKSLMDKGLMARDLPSEMILYTVAACEARMSGTKEPVMTSCGSGNNGITITVPMAVAGRRLSTPEGELARALAVSHLVNAHIKKHIGKLSPICGCGVTAGAGVAAGLVHLMGGGIEEMEKAVESVIASLAGMLCDGGKVGCALKLSAGVSMAFQCAALALEGITVPEGNGIVGKTVDDTLKNLGTVCREGMAGVDATILNVMM